MKINIGALLNVFARKPASYASPWLALTVVYAHAAQGLEPDEAFAMRGMVIAAKPIDFKYTAPGSLVAYFIANESGNSAAQALLAKLNDYATVHAVPVFGTSMETGDCLATLNAHGRFTAPPVGEVIARAREVAQSAAHVNASGGSQ